MNVIFLDFDGVLNTVHRSSDSDIEKRIKLLGEICRELDCKVVIEASAKDAIDANVASSGSASDTTTSEVKNTGSIKVNITIED